MAVDVANTLWVAVVASEYVYELHAKTQTSEDCMANAMREADLALVAWRAVVNKETGKYWQSVEPK